MTVHPAGLVCPSCYWSGGREELDSENRTRRRADVEASEYFCPVCGCHLIGARVSA